MIKENKTNQNKPTKNFKKKLHILEDNGSGVQVDDIGQADTIKQH